MSSAQLTVVDFLKNKNKQKREEKLSWWDHRSANGFYERMTNAWTMWTQRILKKQKKNNNKINN